VRATTRFTSSALGPVVEGHGDALYDFALAVTGSPEAAAAVVAEVLPGAVAEHGPRVTRATLLGSVLLAAVPHAPASPCLAEDLLEPGAGSPDELQRVCREATQSLDARQRGVLDLSLRQGLEGEELGVALGISPGQVSATTRSAVEAAEYVVGAVLLSRLGQEDCPGLAALIEELSPDAGADRVADDVVTHEEECTICGDRRRALVPVTSLLAAVPPTPAPPEMMRTLPLPPVPDAVPGPARRGWLRPGLVLGGVAGAGLLLLAGLTLTRGDHEGGTAAGASPGGRLEVPKGPLEIGATVAGATLELANPGSETLEFTARTGAPWLQVAPGGGRVAPGGRLRLSVVLDRQRSPEGDTASDIRLRSTGGSTVIPVHARVERSPVLSGLTVTPEAAVRMGCPGAGPLVGRASVVEESGIDRVELHQRGSDGAETVSAMSRDGESWTTALGPFPAPGEVEWWVTAFDIRGNAATSPPEVITVTSC
jgi:DNA-directed RNA polymerase specialized sigma24 family protein